MNYFKISQNNIVIDIGESCVYIRKNRILYCDLQDAQLIQGYNNEKLYHDNWLPSVPENIDYQEAHIDVIDKLEFEELKAQLDDNEQILIIEEEPEQVPDSEPIIVQEEEKPMSISEMRETIKSQSEQIEMLTNCILEMSEILYNS